MKNYEYYLFDQILIEQKHTFSPESFLEDYKALFNIDYKKINEDLYLVSDFAIIKRNNINFEWIVKIIKYDI